MDERYLMKLARDNGYTYFREDFVLYYRKGFKGKTLDEEEFLKRIKKEVSKKDLLSVVKNAKQLETNYKSKNDKKKLRGRF